MTTQHRIGEVVAALESRDLADRLGWLAAAFPGAVRFSTSMSKDDQVIADVIWSGGIPIEVITLDTGRLFEETHALIDESRRRYGQGPTVFCPNTARVERLVTDHGPYSFRASVPARQECCGIRKVEPLRRALAGAAVWVTGLRAAQSRHRQAMPLAAWDDAHALIKVNPLARWSDADVDAYVTAHNLPVNPLHDRGFVSIGCAPCTRAIAPGEDPRAGRWWWEESSKECGLHR